MNRHLACFMILALIGLCSCTNGQTRIMVLTTPGTGGNASGDIEAVIAGTGLTGGGTSGSVTLNVNALSCVGTNVSQYNGSQFSCTVPTGSGTQGVNGTNGLNGTGILRAEILANGSLNLTYTNGTSIIIGNLTGPKGATGNTGDTGPQGPAGVNGLNGTDGINGTNGTNGINGNNGTDGMNGTGIAHAVVLANGSLNVTYTNGTIEISGNLTGPKGDTGATGSQGPEGIAGVNGTNGLNGTNGINGTSGQNFTVTNISYAEAFRSIFYAAPAGITIAGMNATARCSSYPIDPQPLAFDTVRVIVDNTNASIGIYHAVYNCTSPSNTFDCTSGNLLLNFSRYSLGSSGMQGPTNNTGNWSLPVGNYVMCSSSNTTNAQSAVLRGSTGSFGAGSLLRLTVVNGAFPQSASFTANEADSLPYTYLIRRAGVVS